ncbi:hypothetical protein ABWK22_02430 [Gottfriedia acidiceleris]|uniref:hypothetical protein n=1 Tax=Gottfriedia acidiceleris TaxID=371036 RepID=UPI0033998E9E
MKNLLEGNRVFKQENDKTRYLFLPEERINKYYCIYEMIFIKNGDLLFPNRWILHRGSSLIPLKDFNPEDYEYMFYPNLFVKWMQKALEPFINIKLDEDFSNLIALENIPLNAEASVRELLEDEKSEPSIVEAYIGTDGKFIILDVDSGLNDSNITEECTSDFADKTIVGTYTNQDEYLFQVVPNKNANDFGHRFSSETRWFHCHIDKSKQFNVLSELYDIEDIIPFTKFELSKA